MLALGKKTFRWSVVSTLAIAFLLAYQAPAQARTAGSSSIHPNVLVLADESGANASPVARTWWRHVKRDLNARVTVSSKPHSGIVAGGTAAQCKRGLWSKNRFASRLPGLIANTEADAIVVSGGAHDWQVCRNGKLVAAKPSEIRSGVKSFMSRLRQVAQRHGVRPNSVYVMVPRDSRAKKQRKAVLKAYRNEAQAHGFTFVGTPVDQGRPASGRMKLSGKYHTKLATRFTAAWRTPLPLAALPKTQTAPKMLVIGDSITARGIKASGHVKQGWWSMVGDHLGLSVRVSAQSGTGVLAQGGAWQCSLGRDNWLRTFGDRLPEAVKRHQPDSLVIAGGANDWRKCLPGSQKLVKVSAKQQRRAMRAFFKETRRVIRAEGLTPDRVFVFTPRPEKNIHGRNRIAAIYRQEAVRQGFTAVHVPPMSRGLTRDGIHPNLAGNQHIFRSFVKGLTPRQLKLITEPVVRERHWIA